MTAPRARRELAIAISHRASGVLLHRRAVLLLLMLTVAGGCRAGSTGHAVLTEVMVVVLSRRGELRLAEIVVGLGVSHFGGLGKTGSWIRFYLRLDGGSRSVT